LSVFIPRERTPFVLSEVEHRYTRSGTLSVGKLEVAACSGMPPGGRLEVGGIFGVLSEGWMFAVGMVLGAKFWGVSSCERASVLYCLKMVAVALSGVLCCLGRGMGVRGGGCRCG
jgi:hypothetical protein